MALRAMHWSRQPPSLTPQSRTSPVPRRIHSVTGPPGTSPTSPNAEIGPTRRQSAVGQQHRRPGVRTKFTQRIRGTGGPTTGNTFVQSTWHRHPPITKNFIPLGFWWFELIGQTPNRSATIPADFATSCSPTPRDTSAAARPDSTAYRPVPRNRVLQPCGSDEDLQICERKVEPWPIFGGQIQISAEAKPSNSR
jgi:hypothetical protein